MNENKIEKQFVSQLDNIDMDTLSRINEARHIAINGKSKKTRSAFSRHALAGMLPCFLVAGIFMHNNDRGQNDEIMIDFLLDETLMESYVYETTETEFSEMLALNTVYTFE